jgi:hypothetical protein
MHARGMLHASDDCAMSLQIIRCSKCEVDIGRILDQGAYREALIQASLAVDEPPDVCHHDHYGDPHTTCEVPGCEAAACSHG